jgi:Ca2+-binding EF-hand superfamily protein
MFSVIDADGDGVISARELRRAAVQLKKLDTDKDGSITLAEAGSGLPMGGPMAFAGPAQFIDQIMQNDKDQNGLTANEVPDHLKQMLQPADINRDSVITREELTVAMQNMRGPFPGGPGGWGPGQGGPLNGRMRDRDADLTNEFLQHDRNQNGLSPDELQTLPPRARAMLRDSDDANGDGLIDPTELQAAIRRADRRDRAAVAAGAGRDRTPLRNQNRRERPGD